ncbi:MAG: hypothetical protein AAGD14_09910 [Planctomycetota bacterium]
MTTSVPEPRKKRRPPWWIWPLGLLVFLVVGHTVWTLVWRHRYESRLEALRAAGERLEVSEFVPEPASDHRNAAVPFAEAERWYDEYLGTFEDDLEQLESLERWAKGRSDSKVEEQRARVQDALARGDPYVALLKQTVARPDWREPLDWGAGIDMRSKTGPRLRKAMEFMVQRIVRAPRVEEQQVEELQLIIRLALHVDSPGILGLFLNWAAHEEALDALQGMSRLPEFEARAVWDRVAADLDPSPLVERLPRAVTLERAFGVEVTRHLLDGRNLLEYIDSILDDVPGRSRADGWWSWPYAALLYRDGVAQLDLFEMWLAHLPTEPWVDFPMPEEWQHRDLMPRDQIIWALFTPMPRLSIERRRQYLARMRIARVGLALHVIRQRTGAWPASLEAVDPMLLPEDRIDPYTGERFLWDPGVRLAADVPLHEGETLESAREFERLIEWRFGASESRR